MHSHRKTYISWILLLVLGFSAQPILANTTPVSAPALPAQQAGTVLDAGSNETISQEVQLSNAKGEVSVQRQGSQSFEPVSANASLNTGDTVKTGNGSCQISIGGKSHLTLQANATLRITEALRNNQNHNESTRLMLQNGKLLVKLSKLKEGSTFEVNTPTAVAVVRGTTFYLNVGIYQGKDNTQMYVDESKGGVLFKNILNNSQILVPAFSLSNAFNDGRLDEPRQLTPEQKEAFVKNFEDNSATGANQQFGIEEIPNPIPAPPTPPVSQELLNDVVSEIIEKGQDQDAKQDQQDSNNTEQPPTDPKDVPAPPQTPVPPLNDEPVDPPTENTPPDDNTDIPTDENTDTENPPDDDTETPPDDGNPPDDENPPAEENPPTEIPVINEQDKGMILDEVSNILEAQGFDFTDANQAVIQDAQTGKVFTDVHGNRVRTDQYIFHQNESVEEVSFSSITLMSITQRTGDYQNGISAVIFGTLLNRGLTESDGAIKDLPWNDWMNVVTDEELTHVTMPDGSEVQFDQYIVHEHLTNVNGPSLYPISIFAVFTTDQQPSAANPIVGTVFFGEFYTDPFIGNSDQGSFWIQGLLGDFAWANASNGENILSLNLLGETFASLNGEEVDYFDRDGSQTAGFASDPNIANLDTEDGINYFRENSVHPAFFEQQYGENRFLYGAFLPINDQGQVIDAPGFKLRGVRDLVYPNSLVNGGNYNLEILLVYGIGGPDSFDEQFRIDTIITPEIFTDFGLKNPNGSVNRSTIFPASLDEDNDDIQNI